MCGRSYKVTLMCLGYPWGAREVGTQAPGMKPLSSGFLRGPSIHQEPLPVEMCMLLRALIIHWVDVGALMGRTLGQLLHILNWCEGQNSTQYSITEARGGLCAWGHGHSVGDL